MLEMQNTGEIGKRNQVYQVIEYVFFAFGIPALCVLLCKMNDSHMFNLYRFDPQWHDGNHLYYWIATVFYATNILLFILYEKGYLHCSEG